MHVMLTFAIIASVLAPPQTFTLTPTSFASFHQQFLSATQLTPNLKISTRPRRLEVVVMHSDTTVMRWEGKTTSLFVTHRDGEPMDALSFRVFYDPDGPHGLALTTELRGFNVEGVGPDIHSRKLLILGHLPVPVPGSTYRVTGLDAGGELERSLPVTFRDSLPSGRTPIHFPKLLDQTRFPQRFFWTPLWIRPMDETLFILARGTPSVFPDPLDILYIDKLAPDESMWTEPAPALVPGTYWWRVLGVERGVAVDTSNPSAATFVR